jgi:hypothetical protein
LTTSPTGASATRRSSASITRRWTCRSKRRMSRRARSLKTQPGRCSTELAADLVG